MPSPQRLRTLLSRHVAPEARDPPARRSAVAAVLRERSGHPEVLLMVRSRHPGDPWSGQVALPGGRHEDFDSDLLATAIRETQEEVGLRLESTELLCRLEPIQARARGRRIEMDVTPFAFWASEALCPRTSPEAAEVFWLPLDRAAAGEFDDEFPYRKDDLTHRLPCWSFEGRRVWGLTFRMLSGLIRKIAR